MPLLPVGVWSFSGCVGSPNHRYGVKDSMKNRLVIAGAGGLGRELAAWVLASPSFMAKSNLGEVVFIDDSEPEIRALSEVVATVSSYQPEEGDLVLCALGNPGTRRKVVESLESRGAQFATFIDDRAVIGANVRFGVGSIVCPGAVISTDIQFGAHSLININCSIGHDVHVDEFVTLSPACNLMGGVYVESDVFFGTAVTVVPRTRVGARSMVGAGSIVLKDIPSDVLSYGNPSRTIRKLG